MRLPSHAPHIPIPTRLGRLSFETTWFNLAITSLSLMLDMRTSFVRPSSGFFVVKAISASLRASVVVFAEPVCLFATLSGFGCCTGAGSRLAGGEPLAPLGCCLVCDCSFRGSVAPGEGSRYLASGDRRDAWLF